MRMNKLLLVGMTAVLAGSLLAGCGSGKSNSSAVSTRVDQGEEASSDVIQVQGKAGVIYSNGGPTEFFETPWLNPGSYMYNKTLFAHLIFADENLSPIAGEGDLAESYEMSEDGKTLSFKLRENILWHDGEVITADDIQWSIEFALKTTVLNSVFRSTLEALEGVGAYLDGSAEHISGISVDGNTITLTFEKVAPDALLTFTQFAPLPKEYLADTDPISLQQAKYFQSPVGSGPFMVDTVQMNNYATLKPFDQYYGGVADFTIHLNPSAGDSDANFVTNAKAGRLDYAYTKNIADIKALENVSGLAVDTVNVRYTRLFLNKF